MPILINKETGLAEDVPFSEAPPSSTHELPLISPEGKHVTASFDKAQELLSKGFTQPNPEQLNKLTSYAKYSAPSEQIKTALEGAAAGIAGPLAPLAERALGVEPEAMRARQEVNPWVHGISEGLSLVGSSLTGVGLGAGIAKAGEAVAGKVGAKLGASAMAKIAKSATGAAVENAIFQTSDEVAKLIKDTPGHGIETAAVNIGLAALLGAGAGATFGAAGAGWDALMEGKVGKEVANFKNRFVERLENPNPVEAVQSELSKHYDVVKQANDEVWGRTGLKAKDIERLLPEAGKIEATPLLHAEVSAKEFYNKIQEVISNPNPLFKANITPYTADEYAGFKTFLSPDKQSGYAVKPDGELISVFSLQKGRGTSLLDDAVINKGAKKLDAFDINNKLPELYGRYMKETSRLKFADEYAPKDWNFEALGRPDVVMMELDPSKLKKLSDTSQAKILGQAQEISDKVQKAIKEELEYASQFQKNKVEKELARYQRSLAESKSSMDTFNAIQDLKHRMQALAKIDKPVDALSEEAATRTVANNIRAEIKTALEDTSVWGKAGTRQKEINKAYSEFVNPLKDFNSKFTSKLLGERVIDPGKVNTYINQLGKPNAELKQEMLKNFLDASEKYIKQIDKAHANLGIENPFTSEGLSAAKRTLNELSTGAKLADQLIERGVGKALGGGLGSMLGSTAGHPFIGAIIGQHALAPVFDSVLPSMAKALIENPSSGAGFKAALRMGMDVVKGESMLNKSAKAVFDAGSFEFSKAKANSRDKLKERIDEFSANPERMLDLHGNLGHYMPEQATAAAETAARATQYLASLRPKTEPQSPLDPPIKPSKTQEAAYNRALDIANNPNVVLERVKNGELTLQDLQHLKNIYPSLYVRMQDKLMNELIAHKAKGKLLPYKTKLGLSMFLGQPLDSSMQPQAIQANQPQAQPAPQAPVPGQAKHSTAKLSKAPISVMTPQQNREYNRLRH